MLRREATKSLLSLAVAMACSLVEAQEVTTRVNLNIRSGPNKKVMGTVVAGQETLTILSDYKSDRAYKNGWVKVKRENGDIGWVFERYLSGSASAAAPQEFKSTHAVSVTALNFRSGPGSRYRDMGTLRSPEQIEVIETHGSWSKIKTSKGKIGYVFSRYIKPVEANLLALNEEPAKEESAAVTAIEDILTQGEERAEKAEQDVPTEDIKAEIREEVVQTASEDQRIEADCRMCEASDVRQVFTFPDAIIEQHKTDPKLKIEQSAYASITRGSCSVSGRGYGNLKHPILGYWRMHYGQDIRTGGTRSPLYAPMDGKVVQAKWVSGYGKQLKVKLKNGYVVSMSHMSSFKVKVGENVSRSQILGKSGSTGLSTGVHLHLEVFDPKGNRINPKKLFKNQEMCGNIV